MRLVIVGMSLDRARLLTLAPSDSLTCVAKALYDYAAQGDDEISLTVGNTVTLTPSGETYADGWYEGIDSSGKKVCRTPIHRIAKVGALTSASPLQGVFPSNYVSMDLAVVILRLTDNIVIGHSGVIFVSRMSYIASVEDCFARHGVCMPCSSGGDARKCTPANLDLAGDVN